MADKKPYILKLNDDALNNVTGGASTSAERFVLHCDSCTFTMYTDSYDAACTAATEHWNANNQDHFVFIGYAD